MSTDIKFVRRVEFDGKEFPNKAEAIKYKASQELANIFHGDNTSVELVTANADAVIAALKPWATPKRRTSKRKATNGATKAKSEAKTAAATA